MIILLRKKMVEEFFSLFPLIFFFWTTKKYGFQNIQTVKWNLLENKKILMQEQTSNQIENKDMLKFHQL